MNCLQRKINIGHENNNVPRIRTSDGKVMHLVQYHTDYMLGAVREWVYVCVRVILHSVRSGNVTGPSATRRQSRDM